ncbi:hypothetical protein GCM10025777_10770 [Membranihabitans marinus]
MVYGAITPELDFLTIYGAITPEVDLLSIFGAITPEVDLLSIFGAITPERSGSGSLIKGRFTTFGCPKRQLHSVIHQTFVLMLSGPIR